jgi:hypothetical protein
LKNGFAAFLVIPAYAGIQKIELDAGSNSA